MRKSDTLKNIMYIDGALNCAYDVFAATPAEFEIFFPAEGQNIGFMDEIWPTNFEFDDPTPAPVGVQEAFVNLWKRPVIKAQAMGIHGIIFHYDMDFKKDYYPTRRDQDLKDSFSR